LQCRIPIALHQTDDADDKSNKANHEPCVLTKEKSLWLIWSYR
jgi:hypothetical protein